MGTNHLQKYMQPHGLAKQNVLACRYYFTSEVIALTITPAVSAHLATISIANLGETHKSGHFGIADELPITYISLGRNKASSLT